MTRVFKVIGILIAVAILLTPIVICVRANHKINVALARAREAGEPLTLEELFPSIPRQQNALYLYRQCFKIMDQMPEKQRGEAETLFATPSSAMDYARLEKRLADWQSVRLLLERAAALPDFKFDFKWTGLALMDEKRIEEMSAFRMLARYLSADALLSAHKGNAEDALHSCALCCKIASQIQQRPLLLTLLVSIAVEHLSCKTVIEILRTHPHVAEVHLLKLLERLPPSQRGAAFTRSLYAERLCGLRAIAAVGVGKGIRAALSRQAGRIMFASAIEGYGKMIELSRKPYYQVLASGGESALLTTYSGKFAALANLLVPPLVKSRHIVAQAEADYRALKLVVALRIYKLRTGSYPETLKPLGEILGELPRDPFTGKDFIYERKGDGFRILRGNDTKDERKLENRYWKLDF